MRGVKPRAMRLMITVRHLRRAYSLHWPGLLILTLLGLAACNSAPPPPSPDSDVASLIDVRLVRAEPAPELKTMVYEGQALHLETASLITDADLVHVEPSFGDGALLLHLELRPEAAKRMRDRTEAAIGERVAIIVDGQVRWATEIMAAVGATRVSMGFPATDEEASRVADLIRSRWLPASSGQGL